MSICKCDCCLESKTYQDMLKLIDNNEVKNYFNNFYEKYYGVSFDLDVERAIANGSWPSSVDILQHRLNLAIERNKLNENS